MYVCTHMCMCVYACECMHVCMFRYVEELEVDIMMFLLSHSPPYFLRQGLLLNPNLAVTASMVD